MGEAAATTNSKNPGAGEESELQSCSIIILKIPSFQEKKKHAKKQKVWPTHRKKGNSQAPSPSAPCQVTGTRASQLEQDLATLSGRSFETKSKYKRNQNLKGFGEEPGKYSKGHIAKKNACGKSRGSLGK